MAIKAKVTARAIRMTHSATMIMIAITTATITDGNLAAAGNTGLTSVATLLRDGAKERRRAGETATCLRDRRRSMDATSIGTRDGITTGIAMSTNASSFDGRRLMRMYTLDCRGSK